MRPQMLQAKWDSTHVQMETNLMRQRDEGERSGQNIISWVLKSKSTKSSSKKHLIFTTWHLQWALISDNTRRALREERCTSLFTHSFTQLSFQIYFNYAFKNYNWKPHFLFEQFCFTIITPRNAPISIGHNKAFYLLCIIAYLKSHRVTEGDQSPRPHLSQVISTPMYQKISNNGLWNPKGFFISSGL